MLKPLRWRLTFLYLIAAIGLVALVGIGTYFLINNYFQQSTDLALQYKMAAEFKVLGIEIPTELIQAEELWIQNNSRIIPVAEKPPTKTPSISEEDDNERQSLGNTSEYEPKEYYEEAYHYEADLAAVFIVPYDINGNPILASNIARPPIIDDPEIFSAIEKNGYDIRTVEMPNQGRIRLLTYQTGRNIPATLQTGRLLSDQSRLLNQYLLSLLVLGGASSVFLALISWWMAGRSLLPAQKAWDQQQTFVSNASHELRTPLTLIRATADYGLRSQQPPKEQSALLTDILNECDYMNELVDDLLLLSRLDARQLKLEIELLLLSEIFHETLRQVNKLTHDKNLIIDLDPSTRIWVRADRTRLRQVLLILLDNALRFTPSGGSIQLSARLKGKWAQIDVADSGQGIAPEHLPHLFDRFYQAATLENEGSRSNGLGLSIARSLVEAQGGSIHIDSKVGKGTHARLFLPSASK